MSGAASSSTALVPGAASSSTAIAPASANRGQDEWCDQCGSRNLRVGVLGLEVCGDCGSVHRFVSELKVGALLDVEIPAKIYTGALTAAPPGPPFWKEPIRRDPLSIRVFGPDTSRGKTLRKARAAIENLSGCLQVSGMVNNMAFSIFDRYTQRLQAVPTKGEGLRRIVGASTLAASVRSGQGVTMPEVAAGSQVPLGKMQTSVWRLCKMTGIRMLRDQHNVEALLTRLVDRFGVTQQRKPILDVAMKLFSIAGEGWVLMGRRWGESVASCFVVSARMHHYQVDLHNLARMLVLRTHTLLASRVKSIFQLLLSVLRLLPWGRIVNISNVHLYAHFVVDHWETLRAVAPQLRTQQLDRPRATSSESESDEPRPAVKKLCRGEAASPPPGADQAGAPPRPAAPPQRGAPLVEAVLAMVESPVMAEAKSLAEALPEPAPEAEPQPEEL